jgi:hypothetical protein
MTAEVIADVFHIDRNAIHYDARLWTDNEQEICDCIIEAHTDWDTMILV